MYLTKAIYVNYLILKWKSCHQFLTKLFSFLILQTPDFYVEMKWEFTSWGKKLNNMFIYYIAKEKVTIYMYMYWLI